MHHIAQEKGDSFKSKEEQKQALGKSFGICRSKSDLVDMSQAKLKKSLEILEKETVGMNSEERETYYRAHLMPYFSTGTIKTKAQDLMTESIKLQEKILKEQLNQIKIQQDSVKHFLRPPGGRQRNFAGLYPKWGESVQVEISPGVWVRGIIQRSAYKKFKVYLDQVDQFIWVRKSQVRFDFATEDASIGTILGGGMKQKLAEKKEKSIFFKPYRPLETLHEVTQVAGATSSSNIVGMEYSQGMLKVTFNWEKLGEVEYGYDVGPDFYESMAKAQSKGKFMWKNLRGKTPGYVIDNPSKLTPGGVGGSIVPYTKLTKRKIQGKEFDKLQKFYAKQLGGKVKVVAHMPFVRKKQKILSRESKPFKKSPGDFVWVKVAELSDNIPIKGHYAMRGGKKVWIQEYQRKGNKAEELKKKIREKGIEPGEIPKTKSQIKQEKVKAKEKVSTQRRAGSEEQKRKREIEKQARGQKAVAAPEPREEAIQKLIEQTGMERSEAEKQIAKLMGLSPEQAKKKTEVKQREVKFKSKNKELTSKILILKQLNDKIQSAPLRNILKLFLKGFMLIATGKDAQVVLNKFKSYYDTLQKEKKLDQRNKERLLLHISKIHKELLALSKTPEDFQYISAAVDKCAKRKMAQAGEKGNYQQFVADCIRIIGISRRRAGLAKRAAGGTASEQRRAGRRVRTQERRVQRGARREWEEAARIMGERREARRQQREERREELRREQQAQRREQERLNTLVEMKHGLERTLGEGNLQDARRVLQWMGTNIGLLREGEVKQRWQGQLEVFERRISRAEEERQREMEERVRVSIEARRIREEVERRRAEVRRGRQERNPRLRRRLQQSEGGATGLQESEGGSVIQQEEITAEQYQMRYGYERTPPSYARLTPPAGMRQTRRGYYTSAGEWRDPVFRTPEQISQATARRRALRLQQGRGAVYTGQQVSSRIRETPAEEAARVHRRTKHGIKMRWRTRVSFDGVRKNSLQDITRADLRRGMRITLNPIAKRDYDFVNPDFNPRKPEREGNRRRIQIRKGESAGIADFRIEYHPRTGIYLHLGTLKQKADFRGRGASSILKPAIMWADSQNMVIGGSPTPIGRDQEVAPAHLSREEQRTWAHNNSRDLNNFYRKLEGVPNYEYGGTFARFPHPERIGGRASDLIRIKLDQAKKHLIFFNPKYLAEIGGYLFYYDPNEDRFYQVDT